MDTIEAIHGRRSIRDYQERPVDRALIEAVVWDAVQAPSTPVSGVQPWTFNVIEGQARIADLGGQAKQYAREHRPSEAGYDWAGRPEFLVFHNAPAVMVISGAKGNSQAHAECRRAGQNLMISAHARGLGTCWVGAPMLWLRDTRVQAELGVPEAYEPHAVFTVGWPAAIPEGQPRERPQVIWS